MDMINKHTVPKIDNIKTLFLLFSPPKAKINATKVTNHKIMLKEKIVHFPILIL